jgi:hypothetical protein
VILQLIPDPSLFAQTRERKDREKGIPQHVVVVAEEM